MYSISAHHIGKSYGNVRALGDISFDVDPGEIYGIIGPDGAGKTTLFRILTTLILADAGTATVTGLDVVKDYREIRNRTGFDGGRKSRFFRYGFSYDHRRKLSLDSRYIPADRTV